MIVLGVFFQFRAVFTHASTTAPSAPPRPPHAPKKRKERFFHFPVFFIFFNENSFFVTDTLSFFTDKINKTPKPSQYWNCFKRLFKQKQYMPVRIALMLSLSWTTLVTINIQYMYPLHFGCASDHETWDTWWACGHLLKPHSRRKRFLLFMLDICKSLYLLLNVTLRGSSTNIDPQWAKTWSSSHVTKVTQQQVAFQKNK